MLGIGCNRGTPGSEILSAVDATLAAAGLASESVYLVATIENKAGESGLLQACRERGWRLQAFSRDELVEAGDPPNPSPYAQAAARGARRRRACGTAGARVPAPDGGPAHLLVEKTEVPERDRRGDQGAGRKLATSGRVGKLK